MMKGPVERNMDNHNGKAVIRVLDVPKIIKAMRMPNLEMGRISANQLIINVIIKG